MASAKDCIINWKRHSWIRQDSSRLDSNELTSQAQDWLELKFSNLGLGLIQTCIDWIERPGIRIDLNQDINSFFKKVTLD